MRFHSARNAIVILCTFILCICTAFADDFKAPFIGSGYVKGTDRTLGQVELYLPINSKGMWGVSDDAGSYLYNVSSTSYTGVLYTSNGTEYSVTCSGFSLPRYRLSGSSSYQYSDLHLTVQDSNLNVATSFPNAVTLTDALFFILVGFVGVILFFMMRYKR